MGAEQAAVEPIPVQLVAEIIGGPFDGHPPVHLDPKADGWPEFIHLKLGDSFPCHCDAVRRSGLSRAEYMNRRMAMYRFEPLANGKLQYVFDRRYNGDPGEAHV